MSNLLVVFLIAACLTVPLSAMFSRRYARSVDFDDKKSDDELLGQYSISFKDCAEKCQKDCGVFGFNDRLKKCRLHRKLNMSSTTEEEKGWRYFFHDFLARDCMDLLDNNYTYTGVYDIFPYGTSSIPVRVFCDMTTMGGGWTAIQKRKNGSLSFDRNWSDYKNGFGVPEQDIWIGNDVIHQLTKRAASSLYVSVKLDNGTDLYELYESFSISSETDKYKLFLAGPVTGTLGDSMLHTPYLWANLSGMYFTTRDKDNDEYIGANCAVEWRGGWWFRYCHEAFLNGPWYPEYWRKPWNPTVGTINATSATYVSGTKMMIKRH